MLRQFFVFSLVCFAQFQEGSTWLTQITPEGGHIRVNKTTVIMCDSSQTIFKCQFKIDHRESLFFDRGTERTPTVVTENGVMLYTVRYVGDGDKHCGISLSNVAEGFYTIGCLLRNEVGNSSLEVTTLFVNDARRLKLKVNDKYQRVEPGKDVDILCSSKKKQKLDYCRLWIPSKGWVNFHKGHRSAETDYYHYVGRGLEKGDCGVKLLNVTDADSGLVWCQVKIGGTSGVSSSSIKVGKLEPEIAIRLGNDWKATQRKTLEIECVIKGAYPLPRPACFYESEPVATSAFDQTPWNETTLRWPWEEQVKSHLITLDVGDKLGYKELKCTVPEKAPPKSLSRLIEVNPVCGKRTITHYDTQYKSKITKRDLITFEYLTISDSGEIITEEKAKLRETLGQQSRGMHKSSVSVPLAGDTEGEEVKDNEDDAYDDDDLFETAWDEITEVVLEDGSRCIGPFTYTDIKDDESKRENSAYPGTPVLPGLDTDSDTVLTGADPNVEFESYPWMAGVYKNIMDKYEQQCGGTLVTEKHVISAAHCFWSHQRLASSPPEDYMIALGKIFRDWDRVDDMVQKRTVDKLYLHPSWRGLKRNFQFDIAVVQLSESVVYTPRVAPACLDWDDEQQIMEGKSGVVTGWGFTTGWQPSEILRYNNLPYVDPDACFNKLAVNLQGLLSPDKFCAGYTNRSTSVCPGDSGGGILFKEPVFDAYFLKGVVSLSFKPPNFSGKCYVEEVTGFTMISQSIKWLKKVLRYIM